LPSQKDVDGFGVATLEHVLEAAVGDVSAFPSGQLSGQMKSMDRVKKEQAADAIVQIIAAAPELIKLSTFLQELFARQTATLHIQRSISNGWIPRCDDGKQVDHDDLDSHVSRGC
jgi:hypothetical protein